MQIANICFHSWLGHIEIQDVTTSIDIDHVQSQLILLTAMMRTHLVLM